MNNKEVRIDSDGSVVVIFLSELSKCLTSKESIILRSQMHNSFPQIYFLKQSTTAQLGSILHSFEPLSKPGFACFYLTLTWWSDKSIQILFKYSYKTQTQQSATATIEINRVDFITKSGFSLLACSLFICYHETTGELVLLQQHWR